MNRLNLRIFTNIHRSSPGNIFTEKQIGQAIPPQGFAIKNVTSPVRL
ncbi:hypothetical protein D082_26440 [Synechocystis sp. PCC 6714]|nr:hypothetical protein D082_26440 [Synechocystis sp. PCC 6714]